METTDTPLEKEQRGFQYVWDKLKRIFTINSAPDPPAITTSITSPTSDAVTALQQETYEPQSQTEAAVQPLSRPSPVLEADDAGDPSLYDDHRLSIDSTMPEDFSALRTDLRLSRDEAPFYSQFPTLTGTVWDRTTIVPQERVPRKTRIRVRYTCHDCGRSFGRDRVCLTCQHRRCTRCVRYPPKRDKTKSSNDSIDDMPARLQQHMPQLSADGGTCHQCQTTFEINDEACPNCHHQICERCIRQPSITIEPDHTEPWQPLQPAPSINDIDPRATMQSAIS